MSDPIWQTEATLDGLNGLNPNTMGAMLGMRFTKIGTDFLRMSMPVDERTKQPMGLLHGGASAALAETIGSVASTLCIDLSKQAAVGVELNCSHLRSARNGEVHATCRPVRIGKSMHVWQIDIENDSKKLVCVCRLTVSIIDRRH